MSLEERKLDKARRPGFGLGLLKGMGVTLKHLFKHNTVIQYPDEKQDLGPRTRGVIALKQENCTVCMLCARECPDWCIYIDSHKETLPPKREGGRPRKRNVLDRFAIDYALCMYCGICVEVCPYDALFWSREFEYAEYDIRELTHEKERLQDWMATVLPPPPLEEGAEIPGRVLQSGADSASISGQTAGKPASVGALPEGSNQQATPVSESAPPATAGTGAEAPRKGATIATAAPTLAPEGAENIDVDRLPPAPEARAAEDSAAEAQIAEPPASEAQVTEEPQAQNVEVPHEPPRPTALEPAPDAEAIYSKVLEEQLAKGSSRQVAEARAKVAQAKAAKGIKRGPTPLEVAKPVPSATPKGHDEPVPSGAPAATGPEGAEQMAVTEPSEAEAGSSPQTGAAAPEV
nr:4Fe-4S binding protein [Actinomycetota bacterium]